MAPGHFLAKLISLPELQLVYVNGRARPGWLLIEFKSVSTCRACPHCASLCSGTYDHRLRSSHKLEAPVRWQIQMFLRPYPRLAAIYEAKERLHRLYRCKGRRWAEMSLNHLLKDLDVQSSIEPLATLAKTLRNWKEEILNHFASGLTNAMTEGFNNKIKLVKRMAYGFRNPDAYNLRILYACYH